MLLVLSLSLVVTLLKRRGRPRADAEPKMLSTAFELGPALMPIGTELAH
jgi:hypothetical protein